MMDRRHLLAGLVGALVPKALRQRKRPELRLATIRCCATCRTWDQVGTVAWVGPPKSDLAFGLFGYCPYQPGGEPRPEPRPSRPDGGLQIIGIEEPVPNTTMLNYCGRYSRLKKDKPDGQG